MSNPAAENINDKKAESALEIKRIQEHMKQIIEAINANNLTRAIIASIEFGEYLQSLFPSLKLEEIQKKLSLFKEHFKDHKVPAMLIPSTIFEAKTAIFMGVAEGANANTLHILTNLSNGINCFTYLLDADKVKEGFDAVKYDELDRIQPIAEKFIMDDLIPNTPARMQMNNAIQGVVKADNNDIDKKTELTLRNLVENLKEKSTDYYSDPDKNSKKTKKLQQTCKLAVKATDKKFAELSPKNWAVIRNNILLAIAAIGTLGLALGVRALYTKVTTGEVSLRFKDKNIIKSSEAAVNSVNNKKTDASVQQTEEVVNENQHTIHNQRI
jgi:hypothetical protein